MSPKERRELRLLLLDVGVAAVGLVALVVNGAYRRWWVSAIVAGLLWLQVALAIRRRRARRALEAVRTKAAGAGSSE